MLIPTSLSTARTDEATTVQRFQQQAPVDVVGLAGALGLRVWEDEMEPGISGKLWRDPRNGGPSGFSIIVNGRDAFVRKRFTVAHEIAHYLLHRHQMGDGVKDDAYYRSGLSSGMETQANRVAAEILMPMPLIHRLFNSGIHDVNALAAALQVSVHALKIRLGIPIVE